VNAPQQKESQIGPVGNDWEVVELNEVAEPAQYGLTASAAKTGNAQFLRITDIEGRNVNWTSVPYCDCPTDDLPRYRLASGDILFARIGATTGKSTLVVDPPNAVFASYLIRVRAKPGLDPEFLSHFFQSQAYWRQIDGSKHTNLKKGVNGSLLKALLVPTPSEAEQRQIALVLSAVQRAIERQERLIALSAELKKALMHKLFTEGTRGEPRKQTEIGRVPKSWEIVRLDQIATIERGRFTHRPRNAPEFYGGSIPFVQTGDVSQCDGHIRRYTQTLNERGLAISRLFSRGTILMTIAANIGYTGILEFDSACTDSLVAITPTRGDCPEFLNHYLQTQQPSMDRMAPQGTQKNINIQFLKPWPIPRPPKEEQSVLADALNKVDSKRRRHEQTRDSIRLLFGTLLHQLMTAQIRVLDLDLAALDEPAAEPAEVT
jgi:type I restriction enzyme, S subunit